MSFRLTHHIDDAFEIHHGDVQLARYVYRPRDPRLEAPKPYLHPIRTLAGHMVTSYRPHDHVWHKGIAVTCAYVDDQNFWGGPTFEADQGYEQQDNCGTQAHEGLEAVEVDNDRVRLVQRLGWVTAGGDRWLEERRELSVGSAAADHYAIDLATSLRNVCGRPLSFGSPTTHGRPQAGYGGVFWRGPRSFTGGRVLAAGDLEGAEAIMGARAAWLAYVGRHDGVDATSTLLFVDHPENVRHPTTWFVRDAPFPAASFAFMFHEEFELPAARTLSLRYRIVVADGAWSRERIQDYLAAHPTADPPLRKATADRLTPATHR